MHKISNQGFSDYFRSIVSILVDLIYPPLCCSCQRGLLDNEQFVCTSCLIAMPYYQSGMLLQKFLHLPKVIQAHAYLQFTKKGISQKLVHQIKYFGNESLGSRLGKSFGKKLVDQNIPLDYDVIIPVPLSAKKLRERGFNQSEILARAISEVVNIPVRTDLLIRIRDTTSQTKKDKIKRLLSLTYAFALEPLNKNEIRGKKVIIVDDVITTGATISEIVTCLQNEDVHSIGVLSLAAAD